MNTADAMTRLRAADPSHDAPTLTADDLLDRCRNDAAPGSPTGTALSTVSAPSAAVGRRRRTATDRAPGDALRPGLIVAAVALIAVTSFTLVRESQQTESPTGPTSNSSAAAPDDPEADSIVARAKEIAALNGDTAPQAIQWVHVDSETGFKAIRFSSAPGTEEAKQKGVAVVIRGSFTENHPAPPLPDEEPVPPLKGTTLAYFYNSSTDRVTAFRFSSDRIDLNAVGPVFTR